MQVKNVKERQRKKKIGNLLAISTETRIYKNTVITQAIINLK